MKFYPFFKAAVAGLACVGTLIPAGVLEAAEPQSETVAKKPARVVMDVRLDRDGVLHGQVVNADHKSVADAVISVREARQEIVRTKSDANGRFAVKDLKPGNYYIMAGTTHGVYRVWMDRAAPPKSLDTVKMISDLSLLRGQDPNQVLYDQNGNAYGQVRIVDQGGLVPVGPQFATGPGGAGFFQSIGVFDTLVLGAGIAGITLGAIALNKADDAEKKVDNLANSP